MKLPAANNLGEIGCDARAPSAIGHGRPFSADKDADGRRSELWIRTIKARRFKLAGALGVRGGPSRALFPMGATNVGCYS
jgi:hypothetical protein